MTSRLALLVPLLLLGCASPPRAEPGSVEAPPSVDPRATERVARLARDVRTLLAERYGPPRFPAAAVRLVPDPGWFQENETASEVPPSWELADPSAGVDDPPLILLAPCFGSWARPGALARWIFHVEWTRGLAPWLREGLSGTVAAAVAAELYPDVFDATVDGLLPPWLAGPQAPFPEASRLASFDAAQAARASTDCARLAAAATDGGEPELVRALLARPPTCEEEIAALAVRARAAAARFPSLARLVRALERRPRASSTTALLEAAIPPAGAEIPDAGRDREALEAKLVALAASSSPDERRLAVYGLGRLGTRNGLVLAASEDPSFHVRVAALAARARSVKDPKEALDLAARLLELAKDVPLEEAPGRPLPALALFDALTGFEEPAPSEQAELSSQLLRSPAAPASYRAIALREAFLRTKQ